MPKITVQANNLYPDNIGARMLFIDSISDETVDMIVRVFFDDGTKEDQLILPGSKFTSPDKVMQRIEFINKNIINIDIQYHYSSLLGYDEARVIGDVNALVKFDNLTANNNRFWGGFEWPAHATKKSYVGLYNQAASGVTVFLDILRMNALGASITFLSLDAADYALFGIPQPFKNKHIVNGASTANTKLVFRQDVAVIGTSLDTTVSTDLYGTPAPLDFGSVPIQLDEGVGIVFSAPATFPINVFMDIHEETI